MKQLFMSQTQSSPLWPGNPSWSAFCPLKPLMGSTPAFWKAEASSVEGDIIKMLGARFSSLEKDLTGVSECHDEILFVFNFIPDLKILR